MTVNWYSASEFVIFLTRMLVENTLECMVIILLALYQQKKNGHCSCSYQSFKETSTISYMSKYFEFVDTFENVIASSNNNFIVFILIFILYFLTTLKTYSKRHHRHKANGKITTINTL